MYYGSCDGSDSENKKPDVVTEVVASYPRAFNLVLIYIISFDLKVK